MTADKPDATRYFLPARRGLADDVYDTVLALLMDQEIEPGSRASIDGIARQLNVSPTPVREALVRLEAEGLVVKRPLKGYTVASLLDAEGLRMLFEMRALLEPRAAANAASRIDDAQLDELHRLGLEMARSETATLGDDQFEHYRAFADQDAAFHRLIAENAGNELLTEAIARLRSHMHLYRLYFTTGIASDTTHEHEAILTALRSGDADAAERAMRDHIAVSYQRMAGAFEQPSVHD